MKNVFKFLGLALVAGAMLVSCGKDFTITVTANDSTMGTVSGGGSYAANETATLTATPNTGFVFVSWQDGNTENPRTITVTENADYVATFKATTTPTQSGTFSVNFGSVASFTRPQDSLVAALSSNTAIFFVSKTIASLEGSNVSYYFPLLRAQCPNTIGTYDTSSAACLFYTGSFNQAGYQYADWMAETLSTHVTAFDATSLKISGTITATMWDQYTCATTQDMTQADAPHENLTATFSNLVLTSVSKGALKAKPIK